MLYDSLQLVLNDLKTKFHAAQWGAVHGLAFQDSEGRVFMQPDGYELQFCGVSDLAGNFCYIRETAEMQLGEPVNRSCRDSGVRATSRLRLVGVWSKVINPASLANKLMADFSFWRKQAAKQRGAFGLMELEINPVRLYNRYETIFAEETKQDAQDAQTTLAALDFNLIFELADCAQNPLLCPANVAQTPC